MKDEREAFIKRALELRVREKKTKKHDRQCIVCQGWVHKDMQSCQPCIGAKPVYSMFHKFS